MDVFDRVMAYNAGREPERLQLKLAAMQADPFTFLRGTCHLFYEDWHKSLNQLKSPSAWICGDLHFDCVEIEHAMNDKFGVTPLKGTQFCLQRIEFQLHLGERVFQIGKLG